MPVKEKRNHYRRRAYQRANISTASNAMSFAKNAMRYGHLPYYYEDTHPDFYQFLLNKSSTGKRIRVYGQWIFVFNSTNSKPTTVYKIPEKFNINNKKNKTKVVFKFFHPINEELSLTVDYEEIDFIHIKSCFKHLLEENQSLSDKGPFCVKQNGQIEKDFKCVGVWRCVKIV